MEEKKSPESSEHNWASMIISGFLGSFEKSLNEILDNTKRSTKVFVEDTLRRIFVFFLLLLGIAFIFTGTSQYLSAAWGHPGSGELAVGAVLIAAGLIWYHVRKNSH